MAVRRMTNPFRRGMVASLHQHGEAWNTLQALGWRLKRLADHLCDWGRNARKEERHKRGDLRAVATVRRSQSLHGTEARKRHMPG